MWQFWKNRIFVKMMRFWKNRIFVKMMRFWKNRSSDIQKMKMKNIIDTFCKCQIC